MYIQEHVTCPLPHQVNTPVSFLPSPLCPSLPGLPREGGKRGSLPWAPIVRGTTNVLQGAPKFLICPGSQNDSRQPCFPLSPSLSSPLSSLLSSPLPPPSSSYQPCSTSTKAMLTRKAARIPQTMPNSLRLTIIPLLACTIHAYNTMCNTHLHRTTV